MSLTTSIRALRSRDLRAIRNGKGIGIFDRIIIAAAILVTMIAIFAPILAPDTVYQSDILNALKAPSSEHWLGTDDQGRDVLWRILVGTRATLLSSILVVACYSTIGVIVATLATIGGRWVDELLMRITDITLSLPGLVVALGFAAALGPSLRSAIIAMILVGWPMTARLLRGIMRETMAQPFVKAATVLGASRTRLMIRHVLPNSLDVLIVKWAADIGFTILVLAGLSFLGVGAQPPSAEWGAMIAGAKSYITTAWWAALFPGVAVALSAATFGLLGDTLQVRTNPLVRD